MKNNLIDEILKEINDNEIIEISQIPNIDLYMDQVTTFIEEKLDSSKRTPEDKILTKTMVNNYTKAGLISPPIKKKYNKENILLLILIYHLKSILSFNDIKLLLDKCPESSKDFIYNQFTKIQAFEKSKFDSEVKKILLELQNDVDDEKTINILLAINLIVQANLRKSAAEKLIDKYFSIASSEKSKNEEV